MLEPAECAGPGGSHFGMHKFDRSAEQPEQLGAVVVHQIFTGTGDEENPVDTIRAELPQPGRGGRIVQPLDRFPGFRAPFKRWVEVGPAGSQELAQTLVGEPQIDADNDSG